MICCRKVLPILLVFTFVQVIRPIEIDAFLGRKYILGQSNSKSFNKLMRALDVGFFRRMARLISVAKDRLYKTQDEYIYLSESMACNLREQFAPGKPFKTKMCDGRTVTSIVMFNGAIMHEVQEEDNGRKTTIDRTFTKDWLNTELKVGKVAASIKFTAIPMDELYQSVDTNLK